MTTRRTWTFRLGSAALAIAAACGVTSPAAAQVAKGFAADRFEPSERGSDWFAMDSLDFRGTVRPAVGIVGDYVGTPLTSRADPPDRVVSKMTSLHAGATVALVDRFRLAVNLPLVLGADGHAQTFAGTQFPAPSGGGVGDVRFGFDVLGGGSYGEPFSIAAGLRAWAPTGKTTAYAGDGEWRGAMQILVAGQGGPFVYAAKFAYVYRYREVDFVDAAIGGPEFHYGLSAGAKLANDRVVVGPEIFGATAIDHAFTKRATPVEALLGAHVSLGYGIRAGAGIGTGVTRAAYGSPDVRVLVGLEWMLPYASDRDGDGVPDKDDACPDQKGRASSDPMKNGCPEDVTPPDKDGDGVIDRDDACVDVPGVKTDNPKTNGCPSDKDGDGVYDKDDACVDVAGVKTDDPKTNGCPPDGDGDGVLDPDDACPTEPGLKTTDPKTNGCPDPDRDKDGVPNAEDACPDEPGPRDPDAKKNGCPKAVIRDGKIEISEQVKFKTGSAQILGRESDDVLQAVFTVLSQHPEIRKVRIEGHTDNVGGAAYNKKLSKDRAASVVKWLVARAIEPSRLVSQGFGPDRPIGDNKTDDGRRRNRRVEFHIVSQTPAEP